MMAAQVSMWLLAAALGQAPAEAAPTWLGAVPAEADVVVRCRGIATAADDVTAMLKTMSPTVAEAAGPAIAQFVDGWKSQYGADVVDGPVVAMLRIEAPAPGATPPFAILVMKDDFKGLLRAMAKGKGLTTKAEPGGYVSFASPFGVGTWYAFDGEGFTAFGSDATLIGGVARPGDGALGATLSPALLGRFLGGDLGVYINVARLTGRYEAQIEQMRQGVMGGVDQAAQNAPNGASTILVKEVYGGLFDSLKGAESLVLNLDMAAEGLKLDGHLAAKVDADAKPAVAGSPPPEFAKLDPDATFYAYMNMDASTVQKWQGMSLRMLNPTGESDPTMDRAMDQFKALGRIETIGASTMGEGMRTFNMSRSSDPNAYVAATEATLAAMKGVESPFNFYKDVKVVRDAQTFNGVSYTHVSVAIDLEKFTKQNPVQGGADRFKAMFGGDSMNYWIGIDGDRSIQVTAPTWDDAKARLERFAKGDSAVGSLAGFKQVQSDLGDRASFLMIASGQGIVRMMASQLAASANQPALKVPADLPTEPAFFGASVTPDGPGGYDFRFSLPSAIGPVFEKGLVPLFRSVQAPQTR